jgi:RHS repeat-associated protein
MSCRVQRGLAAALLCLLALPALAQEVEPQSTDGAAPQAICMDCDSYPPPPTNDPPVVGLTSPSAGQQFSTGASVTLQAMAGDTDGSIARVEFLIDGVEVAQVTTGPHVATWIATTGSHTVKARAVDNQGATTNSASITITVNANQAPAVTLTEPDGNEHYVTGSSVAFAATASDSDGSVNRVEFLVDGAEKGQDTSSPYAYSWVSTAGSHTVQARAVDNLGATKTTAAVTVSVAANTAPSVALTAPTNDQQLTPGSLVALKATASDLEGSVKRVEFLVDGAEVGQDTTSAYQVNWTAAAGSHTIQARAVDNLGASRTTTAITVQGTIAPSVAAATRQYVYDQYQRLCKVIEPETGATLMGYDDAGNLAWSASGLPAATACDEEGDTAAILARRAVRQYDTRNRVTALSFPDGQSDTSYAYTPAGQLDSVTAYNGGTNLVTTDYTYNHRGLLTQERLLWSQAGINWPIGYVYDGNGHLSTQSWHGLNITYAPNALGQPTQAGSYATGVSYWPNGAIKHFVYGNGIVHDMTQNARQLPDTSTDAYGATKYLDDSYDYDPNGNVAAITDGATGRNQRGNRDMSYDGLDRLKTVVSPMYGSTGAAYGYDSLDNLTHVVAPGRDHYYCYDGSNRLGNVKTGSCTGATVIGLGYDVQGNLANKNGTLYTFDLGNRLRGVNGSPASSYVYDGQGRRVRDITTASKYSQYTLTGQLSMTSDGRAGTVSEYVYLGGSLVAIRARDTATNVHTTTYQHTDALGSPTVVTASNRVVLERREYEPFGKQLTPVPADGPGYTGHVYDAAIGLVYMQQRYYDPLCGCFLSTDPVTALSGPFNRYWYANNNPYKFTDPDGRQSCLGGFCDGGTVSDQPQNAQQAKMQAVREAGAVGERLNGIKPGDPREQVQSRTGTAAYRVVDKSDSKSITESKNVGKLDRITNQMKDFVAEAKASTRDLIYSVRENTTIGKAVANYFEANGVQVQRNLPALENQPTLRQLERMPIPEPMPMVPIRPTVIEPIIIP